MTTTIAERSLSVGELDVEIERVRITANAEQAIDAVPGEHGNPFAGSSERLEALESERRELLLRARGEGLLVAVDALEKANAVLADCNAQILELRKAHGELQSDPIIARWLNAKRRGRQLGGGYSAAWLAVEAFLIHGAEWSTYPSHGGGMSTFELPATYRFRESERAVIRKFEAIDLRRQEATAALTTATNARDRLLQSHPALRQLPNK